MSDRLALADATSLPCSASRTSRPFALNVWR
jgi:hypothetical protein